MQEESVTFLTQGSLFIPVAAPRESAGDLDYKSQTPTDTNTIIAWTGGSPATARRGLGVRLCWTTFENPHPRKVIATIDYVSAMAGSAPFLVSLTVE